VFFFLCWLGGIPGDASVEEEEGRTRNGGV